MKALLILLLLTVPALADDLDDAAVICEKHVIRADPKAPNPEGKPVRGIVPNNDGFPPRTWDHCVAIVQSHDARLYQASKLKDEETNPDLKTTRDAARKFFMK